MAITKVTLVTSIAKALLAADPSRQGIIFDNQSASDIYIAGTSDAASITVASGTVPGVILRAGTQQPFWAMGFERNEWARLLTASAWYGIQESGGGITLVIHTY